MKQRKKSLNKITKELLEKLNEWDFDPAEKLVEIYREAQRQYAEADANGDSRAAAYYLGVSKDCAETILQYTHPKRKAVEHTLNAAPGLDEPKDIVYLPDNGRSAKKE